MLILCGACGGLETQRNTYQSKIEVIEDGAIRRGWVPEWLPDEAKDIIEVHSFDTSCGSISFTLSPTVSIEELAEGCRSDAHNEQIGYCPGYKVELNRNRYTLFRDVNGCLRSP